jgi:hypothetical protein
MWLAAETGEEVRPPSADRCCVQSGTVSAVSGKYSDPVTSLDRTYTAERLARIEQTIEEYRAAARRRLLQRAIKLWRKAEADRRLVELDAQPERIH